MTFTCHGASDAVLDVFTGSAAHLIDGTLVAVDPHQTVGSVWCTEFRVLIAPPTPCR